ncbi:MAG: cryptochrome/photolyase family protein [Desulfobaccales bacterium]
MDVTLVFPHQLFDPHPALARRRPVVLAEDPRFFMEFRYHRRTLAFRRATLRAYRQRLEARGYQVHHLECPPTPDSKWLGQELAKLGATAVVTLDPADTELTARLQHLATALGIRLTLLDSPSFLLTGAEVRDYGARTRRLSQTAFYMEQRRRRGILLDGGKPVGGRWTYDTLNRRRLPKGLPVPPLPELAPHPEWTAARAWVERRFPDHPGETGGPRLPLTHEEAQTWLGDFLRRRLAFFGDYQDAISLTEPVLFHSLLSPLLNVGLLTPTQVLDEALAFAREHPVPLNSLEGFVRQVLGWREYVRAAYLLIGEEQRRSNFFGHERPLPAAFYTADTGLTPLDTVLRRVLSLAWCHHIERLMVLGNFLLLAGVAPTQVYRWFMELFIDAYDWVMVPNVFGMSQFADGGRMMTKPYFSGSHYLLRLSDFPPGPWCEVWDGLFWDFVAAHRDYLAHNPRLAPLGRYLDRLSPARRQALSQAAQACRERLWP